MQGFDIYRSDRSEGRRKGGVATYVKENGAGCVEVLAKFSNYFVEVLALHIRALNLVLVNIYRPPKCEPVKFKECLNMLSGIIEGLKAPLPEIVMTGDLNLPHMDWRTLQVTACAPAEENRHADLLREFMIEWSLNQYVACPTREKNILDVILCNNEHMVQKITPDKTEFSDHRWLVVTTNLCKRQEQQKANVHPQSQFDKLNFQSHKIDWITLKTDLAGVDWMRELQDLSVEDKYDFILTKCLEICVRYVPERRFNRRKKGVPRDRRVLMRKRRRIRQKINKSSNRNNVASMQDKISRIEAQLKASLDKERADEEHQAVTRVKTNPKYFFSYAKRKSTVATRIGPLKSDDGTLVQQPQEMADLLRKQYDKVFSVPDQSYDDGSLVCHPNGESGAELLDTVVFTRADFVRVAARLRPTAAAGPDGVPAMLLKKCMEELSEPLVALWETSLQTGEIPRALKVASDADFQGR